MAVVKPGDIITTKCRRCDDVTGHVVMLILDGVIAKVECKACGSIHKYRDAPKVAPKRKTGTSVKRVRAGESRDNAVELGVPRSRRIGLAEGKPARPKRISTSKIESAWQEAMVRLNAQTPVPYSMAGNFSLHDLVDHPVFGRGEVIAVNKPDKVDILFQEGVKTLKCRLE